MLLWKYLRLLDEGCYAGEGTIGTSYPNLATLYMLLKDICKKTNLSRHTLIAWIKVGKIKGKKIRVEVQRPANWHTKKTFMDDWSIPKINYYLEHIFSRTRNYLKYRKRKR